MARHVFRVTDAKKIGPDVKRRLAMLPKAHERAALDAANATLPRVSRKSPVDTGLFKASWAVRRELATRGAATVVLRNDAPYAGIIEAGARPHYPPLAPILAWVQRNAAKLGFVNPRRFRGPSSLRQHEQDHAIDVARAIQRKIGTKGQAPRHIMRGELPFVRRAVARALGEYVNEIARSPMT
jgi:hypothetical protein